MTRYQGISISSGIAMGPVALYRPFEPRVGMARFGEDARSRIQAYEALRRAAQAELESVTNFLAGEMDHKGQIFQAQADILMDVDMDREVRELIQSGTRPDDAIVRTYDKYAVLLGQSGDTLISERAADLRDVRNRLLRICAGVAVTLPSHLIRPCVVVAEELLPSDTAILDRTNALAVVTELGGRTSHSALIAQSYGIPSLMGVRGALTLLREGEPVIVDALAGELIAEPSAVLLAEYEGKRAEYLASAR